MLSRLKYVDNSLWLGAKVDAAARLDLLRARSGRLKGADTFRDVACYCTFIGYQRSAHSVVGSILDGHPNAVISHRLDALKHVDRGCTPDEVFHMILRNSARFARSNRHLTGYSYALPGQGTAAKLTLIGDQEGQKSSLRLRARPDLVRQFLASRPTRICFIHVVRNPLDNIATIANRRQLPLRFVINRYFELCEGVVAVKSAYGKDAVLDVHHEDLVSDPVPQILRLSEFLELPAAESWVAQSAGLLYDAPNRSRETRDWTDSEVRAVRSGMSRFDYLSRYLPDSLRGM